MKTMMFALAAVAAALSSSSALANAELAQKKNCMACHAVDKKVVGPSYKDVAAKYKGQKDAEAKLAEKIVKGGSGVWGPVPMPANTQVSADEAKQLAQWVMATK
ncbi:c-type cytochrome [Roseateles toxinivorans]|uniref:Cytochrome c n=1 Tax=Roseateles toxinivorans TaxID=270368 RepID=A0A4R6QL77_9BURK|nr:c-type cytochrome [Roseateles toxinivorans]TDP64107.1 cytochrome c [Roseateles toxinivorans]